MNLIVDVGNSFIKLAVFDKDSLLERKVASPEDFKMLVTELTQIFSKLDRAIVSAVGSFSESNLSFLKKQMNVHILTSNSKLPFINNYATPHTLGVDRMALVSAATKQFSNKNVLIIDAGSCITYDVLNCNNEYLGGAISPGISMRYKAMHTFTAKLPLLETTIPKNIIGTTTQSSMDVGVMQGILNEMEGFVSLYKTHFSDLTTILTGGDLHFLRDSIKNDIFALPNFLLEGLNHILEINKD
ncbi:MAG: type III pantothenate kinase [Flavobacteriaceae bacterium]|nr:type III pantothenate kinase [Flavobacteriaceae bacterium]